MLSNATLKASTLRTVRSPAPALKIVGGAVHATTSHAAIRPRPEATRRWSHVAETLALALIAAMGMGLALTMVVDILRVL